MYQEFEECISSEWHTFFTREQTTEQTKPCFCNLNVQNRSRSVGLPSRWRCRSCQLLAAHWQYLCRWRFRRWFNAAVILLCSRYNLKSGPSSAAGACNVDGSPFRLSLRVREHNNQTDAHFEVLPNDLRDFSACCCTKESCTRDASSSTVVAWKQERSIFVFLLAPSTCRVSDGQIFNGSHWKVTCSIRDDVREISYFSMIVRVSSYGERAAMVYSPGEHQENQVPESPKTQKIVRCNGFVCMYVKNVLLNIN